MHSKKMSHPSQLPYFDKFRHIILVLDLARSFRCFLPAAIVKSFSIIKAFYGVGFLSRDPTLDLEDQGIPSCVVHHL
jgi:hypothetical protein